MPSGSGFSECLRRRLIFVGGKGGVGKSVVSEALGRAYAAQGLRTLWISFEEPTMDPGACLELSARLWHLNCDAEAAFEEYVSLKIGVPGLARVFVKNKLMKYLSQAAPGMHDLVSVGKVWFERDNYDRIVVDMPSTGYGLSLFQSTANFAKLFRGGPIHADAVAMLETFGDPSQTAHIVLALPEEMPLQEGLELAAYLKGLFPQNPATYLVNRVFPRVPGLRDSKKASTQGPFADSFAEYIASRQMLETRNLQIWTSQGIEPGSIDAFPPPQDTHQEALVQAVSRHLAQRYLA